MDSASVTTIALQIIAQCSACSISLARWSAQIEPADSKLDDFAREIQDLSSRHKTFKDNLQLPHIREAIRAIDNTTRTLWTRVSAALHDCLSTLIAINRELSQIGKSRMFSKPTKQLQKSLHTGELSHYRHRILNFSTVLQLLVHMSNIRLELDRQTTGQIDHQQLAEQTVSTRAIADQMSERLRRSRPASTPEGVRTSDNFERYVEMVKEFVAMASSLANVRPNTTHPIREFGDLDYGTTRKQSQPPRIELVHEIPPPAPLTPTISENDTLRHQAPLEPCDSYPSAINQVDLKLFQHYLEQGQADLDGARFVAAEENFQEALDLLEKHDFIRSCLAFEIADLNLLLARCCHQQERYTDACNLLLTIASPETRMTEQGRDPLRLLTADHMLGQVYLQGRDYVRAEEHARNAFNGRLERLGSQDPSFVDSVRLLIAIYESLGKGARARAFGQWLPAERGSMSSPTRSIMQPAPTSHTQPSAPPEIVPDVDPIYSSNNSTAISPPSHVPTNLFGRSASVPYHFRDDASVSTDVTRTSTKPDEVRRSVTRGPVEPAFHAIKAAAVDSKKKAIKAAMKLLSTYDPTSKILLVREDEIKANIEKRGSDLGLAATGKGYAPIHFFCELPAEYTTELGLLIEAGVDLGAICYKAGQPGKDPMIPLQMTIERGHDNLSKMIVEALDANTRRGRLVPNISNVYDRDGLPPLLAACQRGQTALVLQLLEYGVQVVKGFPSNWYGNSLLHDSCERCDLETVDMLLQYIDCQEQHRDYNNPNNHGRNDPTSAVPSTDIGSISQQDSSGRTPLMYAVIMDNKHSKYSQRKLRDRLRCLNMLLQHGSSRLGFGDHLAVRDKRNMDVFDYARSEGDASLEELLKRYRAMSQSLVGIGELEGSLVQRG